MDKLYFLYTNNLPIYSQLQIEEALLKTDERMFCWINEGTCDSIVMGISSKPKELVKKHTLENGSIPIIRRFSGGGCVYVDLDTVFVTLIGQKHLIKEPFFPESIMRWAEDFYKKSFQNPLFSRKENDFTMGHLKCGGNAQYLRKDRFLIHTSFLWDYQDKNMDHLLYPPSTPVYRKNRPHLDFLTKLKNHFSEKSLWIKKIEKELKTRFSVQRISLEEVMDCVKKPHRKSTKQEIWTKKTPLPGP